MKLVFSSEELIKQNERFYTAKVVKDGKTYFYKKAQTKDYFPQIIKQVSGSKLLTSELGKLNVDWLKIETIAEHGDSWLFAEWVYGTELITIAQQRNRQNLDVFSKLVDVQVVLDKIAQSSASTKPIRIGGKTMLAEAEQKQDDKLRPIYKKIKLDESLIIDATKYWLECSKDFRACIQHADLAPWHLFVNKKDLTLIDCEHTSDDWPRFYDIANTYSALNVRYDLSDWAKRIIEEFSTKAQVDLNTQKAFWGLVVIRDILRIVEHYNDESTVNKSSAHIKKIIS